MTQQQIIIEESYTKGYRVTPEGNLLNPDGKTRKLYKNKKGYLSAAVSISTGSIRSLYVHRLKAYQKYKERIFEPGICVRHLNGNPSDNSYNNIAIGTYSDNTMDLPQSIRISKAIHASKYKRKFDDDTVKNIRKDREQGYTYKDLCKKYNTIKSTLSFLFNKALY